MAIRRLRNTPLRRELLSQCVRQVDLAEAVGIPASSIGHYINGYVTPPPQRRRLIANYLKKPISTLWPT